MIKNQTTEVTQLSESSSHRNITMIDIIKKIDENIVRT